MEHRVLCVGGPLDGQDRLVKGPANSFIAREFKPAGTVLHEYTIRAIAVDETSRYAFVAIHSSLHEDRALGEIHDRHLQKVVDSLIYPC